MPRLWTSRRCLGLAGLLAIGLLQAMAGIAAAIAAVRLLTGNDTSPGWLTAAVLGSATTIVVLRVLQRRWAEQFALRYVKELRLALLSHVLRMPADGDTMRFGLVMTRVVNDFSAVRLWLANGLISILVAGVIVGTVLVYLAATGTGAMAALAPALILWLALLLAFCAPLNRHVVESRRLRGRIAATAGSVLKGRMTYLAFGRHGALMRKFGRQTDRMNSALIARASFSGLLRALSDLVLPVTAVSLALAAVGASDPEMLGVLILVTGIVVTQLNAVAMAVEYRLAHRIAVTRLEAIFRRPTLMLTDSTARLKRTGRGRDLEIDGLAVPGSDAMLSFGVKAGEQVAVTGMSNEETQAVFLRIAGLSARGGGVVRLDGEPATDFSRRDWLRCVCLVSPLLPPVVGTLMKGVSLGNPSRLPDAERERICGRFGLTPEVLQTRLRDETGTAHGTAAAIRAARCLLRGASVVLVDDPDLQRDTAQLTCFLEELALQGTTVILSAAAVEAVTDRGGRVIAVCRTTRQAA